MRAIEFGLGPQGNTCVPVPEVTGLLAVSLSSVGMSGRPSVVTGASDPTKVTHGITLSNPAWAWLILQGHKIIENRQVKLQPGWYAVHTGATASCSIMVEYPLIQEFNMPSVFGMENGVVTGLCKIETSVDSEKCKNSRWACAEYKICNIISRVIPFSKTIKASGNLGAWPLKESTELVRQEAKNNLHNSKPTHALRTLGLGVYSKHPAKRVADKPPEEERPKKTTAVDPKSVVVPKPTVVPKPAVVAPKPAVVAPKPVIQSKDDIRRFFK